MSERIYIDPLTNSVREERSLFQFAKKLGLPFGAFFRLGVLTYSRCLAESGSLSKDLKTDYEALSSKDQEYLKELLQERQAADKEQLKLAYNVEIPDLSSKDPVWSSIPQDQIIPVYIRYLFNQEEREDWIQQHQEGEDPFEIENAFVREFTARHRANSNRPDIILDAGEIRRTLRMWSDSRRGFS